MISLKMKKKIIFDAIHTIIRFSSLTNARNPFSSAMYVTWIGTPFSMYEYEPCTCSATTGGFPPSTFGVPVSSRVMPLSVSNEKWYEPSELISCSWRKICALMSFTSDRSTSGSALGGGGRAAIIGCDWNRGDTDLNGLGACKADVCGVSDLGWAEIRGDAMAGVTAGAGDAGRGSGRTLAFLPNGFTPNGTSANSCEPPSIIGFFGNSDTSAFAAAIHANASMMARLTF